MKKRKRHSAEQIVKKLRDAEAMLAAGKSVGEVLQALEVSEATLSRWRSQYGAMKSEEAKPLKQLEDENGRLKKLVADQALDIQMLKEITKGNWPAPSHDALPLNNSKRRFQCRNVVLVACSINRYRRNDFWGSPRLTMRG
jgi:putative transposase